MEGPELAISLVNTHLAWDFKLRMPRILDQHNLNQEYLLKPARYYGYEIAAIDEYPTFVTSVIRTSKLAGLGQFTLDNANHQYDLTYVMRTYGWVRYDTVDETTKMRNFTALATREALVDRPYLAPSPAEQPVEVKVDIFSIREEYSDPVHDDSINEHYIAAFFIEYNLTITETMYREPYGLLTDPHTDIIGLPYPV